jgi:hypothetical protein
VAGIQAFEQGSKRANQDALTNTAVKIASDIQAHAKEPTQFGGKGMDEIDDATDASSDDVSLDNLGYETESGDTFDPAYITSDGECEITQATIAGSDSNPTVTCESADSRVVVTVDGLDSDGIETTTQEMKS